jgi:hypothetical protein
MFDSSRTSFITGWMSQRFEADPDNEIIKAMSASVASDVLDEAAFLERLVGLATQSVASGQS